MADTFPKMVPTTRSFTMGDYPSKTYRSLSGTIFKRNFGNRQTGYRLDMTFKNIGDVTQLKTNSGTAKQILDHYVTVEGTFESFTLPNEVFRGMGQKPVRPQNLKMQFKALKTFLGVMQNRPRYKVCRLTLVQ